MIYLDNAATSHPKPKEVGEAILSCLSDGIGNPGRSGHALALKAARLVYDTREALAAIFNIPDPIRIAFTLNATHALNMALYGYLRAGDHVVTTSMEHNSVLRPLHNLKQSGRIDYTIVTCSPTGALDPDDVAKAVRSNTKLIVINHASNVCGTIQPVAEVKKLLPEITLLLDAAQTAGTLPLDVQACGADLLAFSGHKGLLGPTGTGGLYVRKGIELAPLLQGGTGSRTESPDHPDFLPDALEAGTQNIHGIAGLGAALQFLIQTTIAKVRQKEMHLTGILIDALSQIPGMLVYGTRKGQLQTATVAINLKDHDPAEVALRLDREFGICTRASLHCAPLAHKTLGSYPRGSVRLAMGYFNTEEDVLACVKALEIINGSSKYQVAIKC
jgi:cysteine desulfurase family protein